MKRLEITNCDFKLESTMKKTNNTMIIFDESVMNKIYLIRGKKVMLDKDLAQLYGVQTKILKQSVKRNPRRFPADFYFELTKEETEILRSQFVTSRFRKTKSRHEKIQ